MRDNGTLHRAAAELTQIRLHLHRTATFRGYRTLTVGASGVVGIVTALLQSQLVSDPRLAPHHFIAVWCGAAVVCLAAAGADMAVDVWRTRSPLNVALTKQAIGHFLPSLILGGAATVAVVYGGPAHAMTGVSMLPGLWALLFSLGCFASKGVLPKVGVLAGIWYGVAGIAAIWWRHAALSPWCMGSIFGGGQLLTMLELYVLLERDHGATK